MFYRLFRALGLKGFTTSPPLTEEYLLNMLRDSMFSADARARYSSLRSLAANTFVLRQRRIGEPGLLLGASSVHLARLTSSKYRLSLSYPPPAGQIQVWFKLEGNSVS